MVILKLGSTVQEKQHGNIPVKEFFNNTVKLVLSWQSRKTQKKGHLKKLTA